MDKNIRIIPRLDIKGPNLVKGVHLEGLRVLGKPWDFAYKYYLDGADELVYIDVVASLYGRNNLMDIVAKTAQSIFIPLTVGGGIRSVEDIRNALRAGADKVAINTAALQRPRLIKEGAETFGSQCIVVSVQAKKIENTYMSMTDNGREVSGKNVFDWVKEAVELGAGELLITSVDNDGTGHGFDVELIAKISEMVSVPVIACGGCGDARHLIDIVKNGNVDAICAASIFHYSYLESKVDKSDYKDEGNIEFISMKRGDVSYMKDRIKPLGIKDVKGILSESGIDCRH